MQLKPGVDGGQGGQGGAATTTTHMGQHTVMSSLTANGTDGQAKAKKTSKTNGYRAKDLAEIRNGLQPFEKNEAGSREPLRTISSLSTESSTNSVCSDGFSSVQEALQKFNILGYDEVRRDFALYSFSFRLLRARIIDICAAPQSFYHKTFHTNESLHKYLLVYICFIFF